MKQGMRSAGLVGSLLVSVGCSDDPVAGASDALDASTRASEDLTGDGAPGGGGAHGGAASVPGVSGTGGLLGGGVSTSTGGSARGGSGNAAGAGGAADVDASASGGARWSLIWGDDFDGATIDAGRWEHEVDCWGGGNGEEQCYVADAKNSFVQDGMLHIVALADSPSGAIGGPAGDPTVVTRAYSSARLRTKNRGDFLYGRFEARLRLPYGQGLWPAFWMLPTDEIYGGWAASGEIDIMEAVNLAPGANEIHGTLHYGGSWPENVSSGDSFAPDDNVWEGFHVYAVEWQEGEVRWYFDDTHYATQTEWHSTAGDYPAPFDERFHLLLNVAVGGAWPGSPSAETTFPQEMVVDYVRVYECAADPITGRGCGSGTTAN